MGFELSGCLRDAPDDQAGPKRRFKTKARFRTMRRCKTRTRLKSPEAFHGRDEGGRRSGLAGRAARFSGRARLTRFGGTVLKIGWIKISNARGGLVAGRSGVVGCRQPGQQKNFDPRRSLALVLGPVREHTSRTISGRDSLPVIADPKRGGKRGIRFPGQQRRFLRHYASWIF